jgi:hypothetical protein
MKETNIVCSVILISIGCLTLQPEGLLKCLNRRCTNYLSHLPLNDMKHSQCHDIDDYL